MYPLLPQLATPLIVLVPAAILYDIASARAPGAVDHGLVDRPLASLYEWLGIALAYGGPVMIADYAALIAMHIGLLVVIATHLQHFAWLIGVAPAAAPGAGPSTVGGVLVVAGYTIHLLLLTARRTRVTWPSIVGGLVAASAAAALLLPHSPLHAYLGLAAAYALLAARPCRHFLAVAWLRPLRLLAAKLYEEQDG